MANRDDFYIVENIIGITGPVHDLPSVYFQNDDWEYGHITQVHRANWNWGRTEVKTDKTWRITNVCPNPNPKKCKCRGRKEVSHEIKDSELRGKDWVFHASRDKFTPVDQLTLDELSVVAQAIFRCPYMKSDPLYDEKRAEDEERYQKLWVARHEKGPRLVVRQGAIDDEERAVIFTRGGRGRRGAIAYTGEGLANELLKSAYPKRVE
jgi:hypothetical protein